MGFLFRIAALLAGSAAITGCAAMPEIGPHLELRAADSLGSSVVTDGPAAPWPGETWWQGYGDAQLSALIEEALALQPDNPIFLSTRGELNLRGGRYDEAEHDLQRVLTAMPDNAQALLLSSQLYAARGQTA